MSFCPYHQGYGRYQRKRRHKRKMKEYYARQYGYSNVRMLEDKKRLEAEECPDWWLRKYGHLMRNHGFTYWNRFYMSGRRSFAKRQSDRRIRSAFRQMISRMDPEDVPAYHGAEHEKEFDYAWTVW